MSAWGYDHLIVPPDESITNRAAWVREPRRFDLPTGGTGAFLGCWVARLGSRSGLATARVADPKEVFGAVPARTTTSDPSRVVPGVRKGGI
jgi:hypothetical protein